MKTRILKLMTSPWSSYDEAKSRSEEIDSLLGFEIKKCESNLAGPGDRADWSHLSEQAFQTPYPEFNQIISYFRDCGKLTWADLGAGYGRLGLMLSWIRPQDDYLGFEFVPERVAEGQRILSLWQGPAEDLRRQDLLEVTFELPRADIYFIYDFGRPDQINLILERLRLLAKKNHFAVVGRGRATRHLIATVHPWLSQVEVPVHTEHWSVYRNSEISPRGSL